jgi:hypothetical protein
VIPEAANDPEDTDLLVYAVRISSAVTTTAVAEYDRLTATVGVQAAEDWREGILAAWAGLATLPALPAGF